VESLLNLGKLALPELLLAPGGEEGARPGISGGSHVVAVVVVLWRFRFGDRCEASSLVAVFEFREDEAGDRPAG